METAALYLRSSKDRSDISLAAQRHELEKLAASRSLRVVKSYEDAVESGKTEDRPGFLALVRDIKDSERGWGSLLVYDTSRIARRRYIAQAIKHEAKKRGVAILYAKLPSDLDPVAELVLESVFEAMDEAHSLMSREKGLAGMAENVRQGWRAGGRAPYGYRLQHVGTGAIREGREVEKSKLIPSESSAAITAYFKARASGVPRTIAAKGLAVTASTLVSMEWNALVYAGHTVWNRHAGKGSGRKLRPREHWQITRNTHAALITDSEAERIVSQLEVSTIGAAVSKAKAAHSTYLLGGLLHTEDGRLWVGHGERYRLRARDGRPGRTVSAGLVEREVLERFRTDMDSDEFLARLLSAAQKARRIHPAEDVDARIRKLEREKARAAELSLVDEAFVALVTQRSDQIVALKREADALRAEDTVAQELSRLTIPALKAILADRGPAKALQSLVERVTLNPDLACRIEYKAIPGGRRGYLTNPRGDATDSHRVIKSTVTLKGVA
jgi:site-specific DNA recombinase